MKALRLATTALVATLAPTVTALLNEKQILEHLYHNLNGDNWDTPWDLTDSPCVSTSYPGVICDSSNSHVVEIDLSDNNLVGSITPHLYSMPNLRKVDFSKNSITNAGWDRIDMLYDSDPDLILAEITVMDLTSNRINSLKGVEHLKDSLTGLHLTYNNLRRWEDELFDLKLLEVLAISENEIDGKVETRLGELIHLRELYCYGNLLTGTLPTEIGKLTTLQIVTFAENHLTGHLPGSLERMSNLKTFSVHNNDQETGHTGPLPKFDNHPFLQELYLDGNSFEGPIPPEFLSMVNSTDEVVTIGLSQNLLTGTIPDSLASFSSLNLNILGNNITGMGGLCESDEIGSWMNGLVERFGCDAILCPVNFYSETGRQEEEESPCLMCPEGTGGFMGATECASVDKDDDVSELEILAEFYLACLGPQWDSARGWIEMVDIESPMDLTLPAFSGVDHCSFEGVTCENGKVAAIALPSNGLEGMIPDSFWDLPELKELDLSGNELRLDRDYGFGDIGNAKNLIKVDLSSNDIQKFSGLGHATSLQELYLDDAYFFGSMNPIIYELNQLKILHMQYSGLKGEIPAGLSKLQNLHSLNLYGNQLTGTIPTEIGQMPKLWHIDFSENDFTGHLPTEAISKLTYLEKFHVSQSGRTKNGISGKLPSFKNNVKLHMLDLSSNSITGSIPSDFLSGVDDVDQNMQVQIGYNSITGTVPGSLSRFSNMTLHAVKTEIISMDSSLCSLPGWMNGEVGNVIEQGGNGCDAILCPKGTYNNFGRAISGANGECKSCSDGKYMGQTSCTGVSLSDNVEKKILDKLFTETAGPEWEGGENWANGEAICSYEGITCNENGTNINEGVVEIDLSGFGLTGNIPTDIYKLPYLKRVDFSNNVVDLSFVGIEQSSTLESITIADADLTSVLGIGNAPTSLTKLHIPRNSFPEGTIPNELYTATSLQSISIGFNGFEGSISSDISKLTNLQEFWAGGNHLTGSIPIEITKLSALSSINLSGNRMSGDIPNELENISTLKYLNLAGQRDFGGFSGRIPAFNSSAHLHEIDISKNSLTGSIPTDFLLAVRTSTSHDDYSGVQIDFSSNRITGPIPSEFDDFASLFLNLAGNEISSVPSTICDDDDEFQNGLVGQLTDNKCDAILCPVGTFSAVGRQTNVDVPCEACPGGADEAPYFGSMKCEFVSEERKTLKHLYELVFTHGSEDKYWNTDNPICTWYGITCSGGDSDDEGVIEINLESNSLVTDNIAEASELFFALPNLQSLNIRGNKLPLHLDSIGNAKNLKMLQLSATGLKTVAGVSAASTLEELHVTENDLKGPFPTEILDLSRLVKLFISYNEISGPLPNEIGTLTNLTELFAYTNAMTGTVPTQLGNLVKLERLVLGQNKFEGTLPTQLNNLVNLKELSFYYENSDGALNGKMLSFSKLTHLESLDLEGNKFTGSIPAEFLSGLDSSYIGSEDNEVILHLADNALTGTLPLGLANIENLFIDIAGNNIKGPIPSSFCQKSSWMSGKVGEVMSCDAIACPANTYSPSGRGYADSDDDAATVKGCTPCGNLQHAPYIGSYLCSHDVVESGVLTAIYHATGGESWSDKTNWLDDSKPICSWHGIKCSGGSVDNNTVTEIDLGDNNMIGTLPSAVWDLPHLTSLDLRENSLLNMGFDNIKKAKKLEVLYISDVDIGHVKGIGYAPALRELHLTSNDLSGTFPDEFFFLAPTLEQLFLAYNSFTGTLSTKFGKFTKLTDFYAYNNDFTGTIPAELATLKTLKNVVLAENKLSGTIPSGFSDMPALQLFSAYRRLKPGPKLAGPLPSFSNVPQLKALYLDYNHLSGSIPEDFLASSLETKLITISHNVLTGTVPLQLDSIENLNIEMEGNKFSDLSYKFCDNSGWMNNAVSFFDCDAIMCPPHTYSEYGRQNSTDSACQDCDKTTDSTPYWGSVSCDAEVDEKAILELLYNQCGGANWHKNDNWMTSDDICTWYGIECRDSNSVQAIRLGANNLIGTPPDAIFELKQLHTLWLYSNPIHFKFAGIEKAQNLVELRLDSTGLSDLYGLDKAQSLVKLNLKYNSIEGPFPESVLHLEKLEYLELTDNMLSGTIPNSFGKVTDLVMLKLGSNEFSGPLRGFSAMEYLLHVDLSDNKLSGTIPSDFLQSLSTRKPVEVDLSSNKLKGQIPTDLDRFDNLVIYLRDNQFTELPSTLCDMNNRGWNMRDVELFGCDAIMCPPGTANYHGRQSSENTRCEKCSSNTNLYGQVSCNGVRLASSSSTLSQNVWIKLVSSAVLVLALMC